MQTATLNLNLVQKRILSLKQAAVYVGLPYQKFPVLCHVTPITLGGGYIGYDVRDLDDWIDSTKVGTVASVESLVSRLG